MKTTMAAAGVFFFLGTGFLPAGAETKQAAYEITWSQGLDTRLIPELKVLDGSSGLRSQEGGYAVIGWLDFDDQGRAVETSAPGSGELGGDLWRGVDETALMDHYVLTGEVSCKMERGYAYLEIENIFGPGGGDIARTVETEGVRRRFEGTQDWRPFELRLAGNTGDREENVWASKLRLSLKWAGSGNVLLRNVRLVQYRKTIPLTPLEQRQAVKWGWIGGVAGAVVGVLGGIAGVVASVRRMRRQKQEGELRRMASLDAARP